MARTRRARSRCRWGGRSRRAEATAPIRSRSGCVVAHGRLRARRSRLSSRAMHAKIKEKREVAKGPLMVECDMLGRDVDFSPGQFFWVTLLAPPYDDER